MSSVKKKRTRGVDTTNVVGSEVYIRGRYIIDRRIGVAARQTSDIHYEHGCGCEGTTLLGYTLWTKVWG